MFFPDFVDGAGYTTQFILYDSTSGPISAGTVNFVSQSGQAMSLVIQ
jgi:hypothetical protein